MKFILEQFELRELKPGRSAKRVFRVRGCATEEEARQLLAQHIAIGDWHPLDARIAVAEPGATWDQDGKVFVATALYIPVALKKKES